MKVLIVDDSTAARFIIRRIVEELGHEVLEAKDGIEALQQLRANNTIELALVDWNMPEKNGLEVVVEMKEDPTLKDVKIMMVTTETEMMQVVRAIEAGANEYLMKPFSKEMLLDKLQLLGYDT